MPPVPSTSKPAVFASATASLFNAIVRHTFVFITRLRGSGVCFLGANLPTQRDGSPRRYRKFIRMGLVALSGPEVTPSPVMVNRIQRLILEILRLTREIRDRIEACRLRQIYDTHNGLFSRQNRRIRSAENQARR